MHDKLIFLLEQIKFPKEYYEYFSDGNLVKIISNKTNTSYIFIIEIDKTLPVEVYDILKKSLIEKYNSFDYIGLKIESINIDNKLVNDYYKYVINKNKEQFPLLEMYLDYNVKIENQVLNIECENGIEEIKLLSIKNEFIDTFKSAGYGDISVEITINHSSNNGLLEQAHEELISDIKQIKENKKDEVKEIKKEEEKPKSFNYRKTKTEDKPDVVLGKTITTVPTNLSSIYSEIDDVTVVVSVFGIDYFESSKSNFKIITLKITDQTDSLYCKVFTKNDDEYNDLKGKLKEGNYYKIRGYTKNDVYSKELVLNARDINIVDNIKEPRIDTCEEKRVELHAHTMMSQMDGLADAKALVKQAKKWGHKAIAITDHNGVQSFPDVYHTVCAMSKDVKEGETPFKAIYGTELLMIDDNVDIVVRPNDKKLLEETYVVFDFETTGFNAGGADSIIEIGAVKLLNGEIIDRFDELIDPGRKLPEKITELTNITDEMLKGKPNEETAVKKFIEWTKDSTMVAHNAKFDVSFLEMAYKKYNLGNFKNTVIDTLELSRTMDNSFARHSLSALVKRYDVPWDETAHHRGDYDAEGTALVYHKMMQKLINRNFEKISDLDRLVSKDEIHKYGRSYHVNLLVKNKTGLKNLFKLISYANTTYLYKTPRILRSKIEELREGILVGSGCYESEVFKEARSKSKEELANIINFYDYVEVQPPDCYDHLLQMNDFANKAELIDHIKKIIDTTVETGKIIVATGDVHHINKEDKIYREIIVNQKVPGGGRHPLARNNITSIPSMHFRTTDEMLKDFDFLDNNLAYDIVVKNTNKIADMCDIVEVIIETGGVPFSPKIENSVEIVNEMVYGKAKELYGDPLPDLIKERIEQELKGIIGGGFDVIYLIAQKLIEKSNNDGYLVGSRGSVGSSFVATMMGITEVNPLAAHYRCPNCKHSIFDSENGDSLGSIYSSGFDLPDMDCPKCKTKMLKDGQDMPFATFLGFNADKVPDIDLNFSDLNQAATHEYTKVLFGVDNVYRAGTIGTVASKTAFGYVKGYLEEKGITKRTAEVERLSIGCTGVKRTTGQHPGGIVVIPGYMDVFDFTPFQYPADDPNSAWRTTHFDYHAIDQDVLKLDILGHSDPTQLRMLKDLTGIEVTTVPLDDRQTMDIFLSPEPLGVTSDEIMCKTGTLGVPEFGTPFTIQMLLDTKPTTFAELIKISGLSHGTDVWLGNAQELIRNNIVPFKNVIGCRDDIMVYLIYNGLEPIKAFKIMEFVRKGKASKPSEHDQWVEYENIMKEAGIEDWFIDSCAKIKYMFPKAHAAAYVISAFRIAYFKVHYPVEYYASYMSSRITDFDIDVMIKGYDAIKQKMNEIIEKNYDATNKETAVLDTLRIALEATARGVRFEPISLEKSDSINFLLSDDKKSIIPPFRSIDGLGETVAKKIVEERNIKPFMSIEDFATRGKVSSTLVEKMRSMGILDGMDESSQLTLF